MNNKTVEYWRKKLDNIAKTGALYMTSDVYSGVRYINFFSDVPKFDNYNWIFRAETGCRWAFVEEKDKFWSNLGKSPSEWAEAYPPWMLNIRTGVMEFPTPIDKCGCPVRLTLEEWAVL